MPPKLPWFPFFPNDYLSDSNVIAMNRAQRGSYANLLCIAWNMQPKGTLPDDDELLAVWAQCSPEEWLNDKPYVMRSFKLTDGVWTQKRLYLIGSEQDEFHDNRVKSGQKGGRAKAQLQHSSSCALENQNQNQITEASSRARTREPSGPINGSKHPASKQASEHLLDLSEASIEELQAKYPKLDVRALVAKAQARCAKRHPHGGPMKLPFFQAFLEREEKELDPPGLVKTRKEKLAQIEEAVQDRHLTPEEEDALRKQMAEELRKFRHEKL